MYFNYVQNSTRDSTSHYNVYMHKDTTLTQLRIIFTSKTTNNIILETAHKHTHTPTPNTMCR